MRSNSLKVISERRRATSSPGAGKLQPTEVNAAFAVKNGLLQNMSGDPKPVSDRHNQLKFPLVDSRYCTLSLLMPRQ